MSFLAPLFLLGGLVIAGPIIFHLIRRTPIIQRQFSSLMFLMPSPPQLSRRSRLDKILLLLLRCLVIVLLALAFARPFLRTKLPATPATGPMKISFVLLDTSASMRRGNLWSEATARAQDYARRASPADRLQVATFDRGVRKVLGFDEWTAAGLSERAATVGARLAQTGPGWVAGDLGSALVFAAEELDSATQQFPDAERRIVVISDLQEGSRFQNLQGYEWPKGVAVVFERVGDKGGNNAGIHAAFETEVPAASKDARPSVRVSNAGDSKREQFRLGWVDAQSGGPIGNSIDVYVPAGKTRVIAAPKRPEGGVEAQLVLMGDDEPFDNRLYVGVVEPERVRVMFAGAAAEDDPEDLLYFLRRAFQETRLQSVTITPLRPGTPWTIPAEARFLVVGGELGAAEAQTVRKFIEDGGTALLVMKSVAGASTLERLANAPGLGVTEASVKSYAMLEQIDFNHPIFAAFADPRFSDFTRIHFWKHRRVETNALSTARIIAAFDNGAPALIEIGVGKGTLLTLTCGWHPADSQLALSSKFVPLLYSMLEYAGCFRQRISQHTVGSEVVIRTPQASVRGPAGTDVAIENGRFLADTPGLYTVTEGGRSYKLAVNLDPAESQTAPLEIEELEKLGVPVRTGASKSPVAVEKEVRAAHAAELEGQQKLWRWLVAAAVGILLGEIWLAARLSRPQA